jgi:hypothetical protein
MKRDLKLQLEIESKDEFKRKQWSTEQHSLEKWFTAELFQSIDNDGVRRFLVIPTGPNAKKEDTLRVRLCSTSRENWSG